MSVRKTVWMFLFLCFATPWGTIAASGQNAPIKAKLEKAIDSEKKKIASLKDQLNYQKKKRDSATLKLKQYPGNRAVKLENIKRKVLGRPLMKTKSQLQNEIATIDRKMRQLSVDIAKSQQRLAVLTHRPTLYKGAVPH